ncbi:S1 family serine peptidase [Streptomyces sp. NPDC048603]|uniref:S1 family serine peptidase n=1 Tax=Streptomyces sp. NPDC048603 TaxID=3365577 RepID=UPI003717910A
MQFKKFMGRRPAAVAGAVFSAALLAAVSAPANAATASGEMTDAEMLSVVKAYSAANPTGPEKDTLIIGGAQASIKQYPYMAQIFTQDYQGRGYFCSGSVVGPKKILTAAHCLANRNPKKTVVVTGATHRADQNGLYGGKMYAASKHWIHGAYNASKIDNDIAVVTLSKATAAKPIKTTWSGDTASYKPGTKSTALGWGRTSGAANASLSPNLKKVDLPIQSDWTCKNKFWGSTYIKGHMVCAGKPATGRDAGTNTICNGDSGGPLVVNGRVVGINSFVSGRGCTDKGSYPVFVKYSWYSKTVAPQIR